MILAVLAALGGFVGLPDGFLGIHSVKHALHAYLNPAYDAGYAGPWIGPAAHFNAHEALLMGLAVAGALAAIYFAYMMYRKHGVLPDASEATMSKPQRTVYNKYYVDEIYDAIIRKPLDKISDYTYRFFEIKVVDSFVNGIGTMTRRAGDLVKLMQAGTLGFYVFAMTIAVILIFAYKFF
jgi:NADH-quinone oxidoreductase subunit L